MNGIGNFIMTIFIVVVMTSLAMVMNVQFGNPALGQQLNGTLYGSNGLATNFQSKIYTPINSTAQSGSGLGATISTALGYAFIYPAIFSFAQTIVQTPQVIMGTFQVFANGTGFATLLGINLSLIVGFGVSVLAFYLLILIISSWQKYDLWGK